MRILLLSATLLLPIFSLFAQETVSVSKRKCITAELLQQQEEKNPNMESQAQFESWVSQKITEKRATVGQNAITNYAPLPVIFHILHTGQAVGTGYNVSQALIQAQLIQLNKDFANLSGSPYSAASSTGLQFCLAQTNASGATLEEPGIDRINASATGVTYGRPPYTSSNMDSRVKPATIWDPTKYINVWVIEFGGSDDGVLGYATFPSSSTLSGLSNSETANTAGVVIQYTTIGSLGTPYTTCSASSYNTGRTLTHELGHFFGLRHIWGDNHCGTDYCDDTPVHEESNYGAPSHPKANSCGTADEMFENYMDYTNDYAMNTFTLNQAERMQVVMLNSIRRRTLPTSTAGCGTVPNASKIAFSPCAASLSISEQASQVTTCPYYNDVKLFLNIESAASAAATLNITTTGTATAGVDYEIINPTISIAAGDNYKEVVVRIYDDVLKESSETIVVSYTITGTGVVANSTQPQSFTITILDDEDITISQNEKTIFSQDFGTSGGGLPTSWRTYDFLGSSSNRFLVSSKAGSAFTGQALHISNRSDSAVNYSLTSESWYVAQTPLVNTSGYRNLNLTFKYQVAGEYYQGVPYDYGKVMFAPSTNASSLADFSAGAALLVGTGNSAGTTDTVTATTTRNLPYNAYKGRNIYLYYTWYNDGAEGSQPPLVVDDVVLTGTQTKVESQLTHGKELNIATGGENYIVSKQDNEILAMISNSSAAVNCVNAAIQQAGNGQIDLTTSTGVFKRTEKVVKLTPAATSNATYTITLYYTTAELAAWGNIANLKVMKVQDGVDLSTTLTSSNAVLYTPTVADNRTAEGYAAFTVTATGFSQFFLVEQNTTLPVQLVSFTAVAQNNNAILTWVTSNESNNQGFTVERSMDGVNFTDIGFVASKSTNSGSNLTYTYTDPNLSQGITYYYRLRQTDLDGNSSYTVIRNITIDGVNKLVVYPNPVSEKAYIIADKAITAAFSLHSIEGKILWQSKQQNFVGRLEVPMKNLPAGVYMLQVQQDGGQQTYKIVKQ